MNTNKKFERLQFTIPNYYASALILGDFSGLSIQEELEISKFIVKIRNEYGHANFVYDYDTESYFSARNDVNNLAGDVAHIFLIIETK
jgi:hypothetical protein